MKKTLAILSIAFLACLCGCKDVRQRCSCGPNCKCGIECRCGDLGKCTTSCTCPPGCKCADPVVSPDTISDKEAKDGEAQLPKMVPWFKR